MTAVRVFDPAMCCSTGVCGPSVDPQVARFAADLDWLKAQGVSVERFNLAQQPGAFVEDAAVRSALETKGEAGLPIVKVNGETKYSGVYPTRAELAAWVGLAEPSARKPTGRRIMLKTTSSGCWSPASAHPGDMSAKPKSGCC